MDNRNTSDPPSHPPGLRRSLLFAPGHRPDRFSKAIASGADIVCLDLEDGVQSSDKDAARDHVIEFLGHDHPACETAVRINSMQTRDGLQDVLALATSQTLPDLIVLPKVESAEEVQWVARLLRDARRPPGIVALVESPKGLTQLGSIATAPATAMLGLGTADLAAEMNVTMDWSPMLLARMQVVQAAALAGIGALDGAWLQLQDADGLENESRRAAELGFTAKICIHPQQVAPVHASFTLDEQQTRLAQELIAAFEAAGGGALQFNGRMIDLPVVNSARRRLRRWQPQQTD